MSQHPEPYAPYCGLVYNEKGQPERISQAHHHIWRSAPRPAPERPDDCWPQQQCSIPAHLVAVSSKEDLAELVLTRRCFGPTGVIDLRPEKTLVWPQGVTRMVSDPTMSITSADEALTVAETMLATSGVGFGGASSGQTVAAGGLWEATASRPLACLLYAASPQGNGQGMPWLLEAVEHLGIEEEDEGGNVQLPLEATPSWLTAAALCPHPMLVDPMQRVLTFNSRMRDSVAITVSKAVTPWVRLGLSATDHLDRLSAVDQLSIESFDISMLDEPDASLFVIAPNTGTVAGAAVALIDSIIRHFRKRTAQHQMDHRLLLELDEVCNSCPLPALLNYVGESAGLGVNIMATVQASSHFDVVYGPKYADALRDIFPGTVVMYGAHERHLLEQASHWSGLATRRTESYEPARWRPLAVLTTGRQYRLARATPPDRRGGTSPDTRHLRSPRTNTRLEPVPRHLRPGDRSPPRTNTRLTAAECSAPCALLNVCRTGPEQLLVFAYRLLFSRGRFPPLLSTPDAGQDESRMGWLVELVLYSGNARRPGREELLPFRSRQHGQKPGIHVTDTPHEPRASGLTIHSVEDLVQRGAVFCAHGHNRPRCMSVVDIKTVGSFRSSEPLDLPVDRLSVYPEMLDDDAVRGVDGPQQLHQPSGLCRFGKRPVQALLMGCCAVGDQGSGASEVAEVGFVARDNRPALDNRTVATQLDTRIVQRFRYPNRVGEHLARNGLRLLLQHHRNVAGGQVAAIVRLEVRHCPVAHECASFHGEFAATPESGAISRTSESDMFWRRGSRFGRRFPAGPSIAVLHSRKHCATGDFRHLNAEPGDIVTNSVRLSGFPRSRGCP